MDPSYYPLCRSCYFAPFGTYARSTLPQTYAPLELSTTKGSQFTAGNIAERTSCFTDLLIFLVGVLTQGLKFSVLPVWLPVCLSVYLFIYQLGGLSVCLSASPSVCLHAQLSVCLPEDRSMNSCTQLQNTTQCCWAFWLPGWLIGCVCVFVSFVCGYVCLFALIQKCPLS